MRWRPRSDDEAGFSRPLALLAAGALFMENLDGTVLATAAPAIGRDFGVAPESVNTAMVAYLLAVAIVVPVTGWLADRFGTRRTFLWAIAGFTAASVACALAPDLLWLCVFRAFQGIAGALLIPIGRLAVLRDLRPVHLLAAMAYLTWPSLIAPVAAPFLGGLLADTLGWEWIFLINVPIGIGLAAAGLRLVPHHAPAARTPLDRTGFFLIAGAITCLTGAVEIASTGAPGFVAILLGAALALAAGAASTMRRREHPLFDTHVLRIVTFRVGNVSGSVYRMMITAAPFLFALLFQAGFGWSAAAAGAVITTVFAGNLGVKPFTTPIIRRLGFRTTLIWSNVAGVLLLGVFAFITASTPVWLTVGLLFLGGVFRSIGFSAYNTVQFADVPPAQLSDANTLSATLQQVGTALGTAVAALAVRIGIALTDAVPTGAERMHDDPALPYRLAFVVAAAIMLLPLVGALRLPADAGHRAARR
ncbi:MAG: MFS transporter [Gordonia sp. (in: high G+C Gram-positive bacteria)]|uniref:MFS transporter n=1 Tax=Gordonia sp. (in: high G+C Gram-positive bacteria) TaxID=84139 RepID=UPI0039E6A76B